MKVNMTEATARKVLGTIPAGTGDPDLQLLQKRLEAGLQATAGSMHLTADELQALVALVGAELSPANAARGAVHFHPRERSGRPHLDTALPKLQALLERRAGESNG